MVWAQHVGIGNPAVVLHQLACKQAWRDKGSACSFVLLYVLRLLRVELAASQPKLVCPAVVLYPRADKQASAWSQPAVCCLAGCGYGSAWVCSFVLLHVVQLLRVELAASQAKLVLGEVCLGI
jgi:hypothetical protein